MVATRGKSVDYENMIITGEALAGDGGLYMGCDILALTINKYDIRTKTVLVVIVSK